MPYLPKTFLAQIRKWWMSFTNADVSICIDDRAQDSSAARHDLRPLSGSTHFRPLKHRLNNRSESASFARSPQGADVLMKFHIFFKVRALKRRILSIAADQSKIVVIHRRTSFEKESRELSNLVQILSGCGRDGMNPQSRIAFL